MRRLNIVRQVNHSIIDRPANMTVCVHMGRGNYAQGMAEGGYEPIAERMFDRLDADGGFLEYDTPRAGDFNPLRQAKHNASRVEFRDHSLALLPVSPLEFSALVLLPSHRANTTPFFCSTDAGHLAANHPIPQSDHNRSPQEASSGCRGSACRAIEVHRGKICWDHRHAA
jgi:hypothetical protein